jgi:hypothetical protein
MSDIKHKLCNDADRSHKMQRLYKRVDGKFIPCAWMCPDCGQMKKDQSSKKWVFLSTPFPASRRVRAASPVDDCCLGPGFEIEPMG